MSCNTGLIVDANVRVPRGQDTTLRVRFPSGTSFAGWTLAQLTIREDPSYPRTTAAAKQEAAAGEIDVTGWTQAAALTSYTVNGVSLDFTLPRATALLLSVGKNRYVIDGFRKDSGTHWQFLAPTWVSVLESILDG